MTAAQREARKATQGSPRGESPREALAGGAMLCFIHVPKCGGTTFRSILDSQFDLEEICRAGTPGDFQAMSDAELAGYRLLRGHFGYDIRARLPGEPLFVTLLRHPVERVVSLYHYWRRAPVPEGARGKMGEQVAKELDLKDFLRSRERRVVWWVEDAHVHQIAETVHTGERGPPDRRLLDRAKAHLEAFACFGLAERFDDSVALLADAFGWPPQAPAPDLNVTADDPAGRALDDEALELARARVGLDLELYSFAQELFERRLAEMRARHAERPPAVHGRWPRGLPADGLELPFDKAVHGLNWHIREGVEAGRCFRWTGPGRAATLDLVPETAGDWTVRLDLVGAVTPETAEAVRASAGGEALAPAGSNLRDGAGTRAWRIPARLAAAGAPLRLAFEVPQTRALDRTAPGRRDAREVGIAVERIVVAPAEPGLAPATSEAGSLVRRLPAALWRRLAGR